MHTALNSTFFQLFCLFIVLDLCVTYPEDSLPHHVIRKRSFSTQLADISSKFKRSIKAKCPQIFSCLRSSGLRVENGSLVQDKSDSSIKRKPSSFMKHKDYPSSPQDDDWPLPRNYTKAYHIPLNYNESYDKKRNKSYTFIPYPLATSIFNSPIALQNLSYNENIESNNNSNGLAISIGNVIIYNNTYNSLNAQKHLTESAKFFMNKDLNLMVDQKHVFKPKQENSISWSKESPDFEKHASKIDPSKELDGLPKAVQSSDWSLSSNLTLEYVPIIEGLAVNMESIVSKISTDDKLFFAVKRLVLAASKIFMVAQSVNYTLAVSPKLQCNTNTTLLNSNNSSSNQQMGDPPMTEIRQVRDQNVHLDKNKTRPHVISKETSNMNPDVRTGKIRKKIRTPDTQMIEQDLEGLQRLLEVLEKEKHVDVHTIASKIRGNHKRSYLYKLWKGRHRLPLAETVDRVREELRRLAERALKRARTRCESSEQPPDHWTILFCLAYAITVWLVVTTMTGSPEA